MIVTGILTLLSVLTIFRRITCTCYFSQVDRLLKNSSDNHKGRKKLLSCARMCCMEDTCLSYTYNKHDGSCKLNSCLTKGPQKNHFGLLNCIRVNSECNKPLSIPKGRLLSVDGQLVGAKAWFTCDDYHFSNIAYGVCRADGTWKGLDNPCVYMPKQPYDILSSGRIAPGRCLITLTRNRLPIHSESVIFDFLANVGDTVILHMTFNGKRIVMITSKGRVNSGFQTTPYTWPDKITEVNVTICTEDNAYRIYCNGSEKAIYKHHYKPTEVYKIRIKQAVVRNIKFTIPSRRHCQ